MEITVNGKSLQIQDDTSIQKLLDTLALGQGRIAVELNEEILPRSQFPIQVLKAGDKLEIVQAIGGG